MTQTDDFPPPRPPPRGGLMAGYRPRAPNGCRRDVAVAVPIQKQTALEAADCFVASTPNILAANAKRS